MHRSLPLTLVVSTVLLAACSTKQTAPVSRITETSPAPPVEAPYAPPAEERSAQPPGLAQLQQELAASAGDRVFFALDSHDLGGDARAVLTAQAQWLLRRSDVRVLVAGNCDERGTREYNFALGARRAAAARDFLVAQGVPAGRIETVSYGKERPIDAGSEEGAWSRNRNASTGVIDLTLQ